MNDLEKYLKPNRDDFGKDPFGYSAMARHKWGTAATISGFPIDISKPATSEELKNPVLWMSQAHALSEAAVAVLRKDQEFEVMPLSVRSACDSQYCAVGLMLVGYSLEICLKSMIIIRKGVEGYKEIERKTRHHRLHDLAKFAPDLSKKEIAILRGLTHFVYWAGRYPDPGSGREDDAEEIFEIAEKYRVTAHDLFKLSTKVMRHAQEVTA
jgi:HEPN domain